MSLIFIGTPAFAVPSLRRLASEGYHISAVITQPDRPAGRGGRPSPPPVKAEALALGLLVLQPATLRDKAVVEEIRSLRPEVMAAVAYGRILREAVLDIAPRGVLNVHPSLLPRWRGASPIASAILAGDEQTGVTIILMDPGTDSGPILAQEPYPISDFDTAGSLTTVLADAAADLLARTLPRWLGGEIEPQPQDESRATLSRLLKKEDGRVDWSRPAVELWRQVRAYNPWPGAYTTIAGELLHIWEAWPLQVPSVPEPGTIADLVPEQRRLLPEGSDPEAFAVQTGDGLLAVLQLQRAGRRALSAGEFRRGFRGLIGRRLGD